MPREREAEARARGDIVRGRLASVAGGLVGAAAGLELVLGRAPAAFAALARADLGGDGAPAVALRDAGVALAGLAVPVLLGAVAGALAAGLLQTRGYLGRPGAPGPVERTAPSPVTAIIGWAALVLVLLELLRASPELARPAAPAALGVAALRLGRTLLRAGLVGIVGLALIDHLLRARARGARLAEAGRRAPPAPFPATQAADVAALLDGATRILYVEDLALVLEERGDAVIATARVRGLAGRALVDLARRRGVVVRAARTAAALEAPTLGAVLGAAERAALELPERRP